MKVTIFLPVGRPVNISLEPFPTLASPLPRANMVKIVDGPEPLFQLQCHLGEGPIYDSRTNRLYFVGTCSSLAVAFPRPLVLKVRLLCGWQTSLKVESTPTSPRPVLLGLKPSLIRSPSLLSERTSLACVTSSFAFALSPH